MYNECKWKVNPELLHMLIIISRKCFSPWVHCEGSFINFRFAVVAADQAGRRWNQLNDLERLVGITCTGGFGILLCWVSQQVSRSVNRDDTCEDISSIEVRILSRWRHSSHNLCVALVVNVDTRFITVLPTLVNFVIPLTDEVWCDLFLRWHCSLARRTPLHLLTPQTR
jgi:hypothetical protein